VTDQLGKVLGLIAVNQAPNRGVISVTLLSETVTEKRSRETALLKSPVDLHAYIDGRTDGRTEWIDG